MKRLISNFLAAIAAAGICATDLAAKDREPVDGGMTVYMQLGGNPGGPATLARELGARDAQRVF